MAKDPAFLFYSKDFYEGTRTMLPKERACLVDLMIYQHQNGAIPNDLERVAMYCNGIDEATLEATLKAKFKLTDKGWISLKMREVIDSRLQFSSKQSDNGIVGQFFKKAKATLNKHDYQAIRDYVFNVYTKQKLILELKKDGATHEALLEALLKHLANENEDVNEDVVKDYKGVEQKKSAMPTLEEFINYGLEQASKHRLNVTDTALSMKYQAWKLNSWKNGNNQPIKNWKSSLINTLKYIQETEKGKPKEYESPEDREARIFMEELKRQAVNESLYGNTANGNGHIGRIEGD